MHIFRELAGVGDRLESFEDEEAIVGEEKCPLFFG